MKIENTQIVILCGGLGTRMREETEYRPKPLVEIGGKPILWHIMKIYASYGFKNFILCLGYKGEMIKEYFYNYEILNNDFAIELGNHNSVNIYGKHKENGWRIILADTGHNVMTGARLKKVEQYIKEDTFMLTYGDGVADINIKKLFDFHKSHGRQATITGVRPQSRFGELIIQENKVVKFSEKSQVNQGIINGGFFVFNKSFLDYVDKNDNCILEKDPLEKIALNGELMVYFHDGFWQCIDTYREYQMLNSLWNSEKCPWKIWE